MDTLKKLHERLGYKQLNRTWAKLEILLGLLSMGIGLFLGEWTLARPIAETEWRFIAGALALFVLGGYLALAGHRSHLYQSNNKVAAYVVDEIRRLSDKASTQ